MPHPLTPESGRPEAAHRAGAMHDVFSRFLRLLRSITGNNQIGALYKPANDDTLLRRQVQHFLPNFLPRPPLERGREPSESLAEQVFREYSRCRIARSSYALVMRVFQIYI